MKILVIDNYDSFTYNLVHYVENITGKCPDVFLNDRIGFWEMSDMIEACMQKVSFISTPIYEDYVLTDQETRTIARELLPV